VRLSIMARSVCPPKAIERFVQKIIGFTFMALSAGCLRCANPYLIGHEASSRNQNSCPIWLLSVSRKSTMHDK